MVLRPWSWAIAALVLAALPGAAHGASRVATRVHLDGGQVRPGKDAGYSWRCPKRWPRPVAAQFYGGTEDLALDDAYVFGGRRRSWDVGIHNFGEESQIFFAAAVCLRAPGRFSYPTRDGVLEAGAHTTVEITCRGKAPRAINGMLEPKTRADVGKLVMTASAPAGGSTGRWQVGVRNLGTGPQSFRAGAVCASRKLRVVHRFTDPLSVAPGEAEGGTGTCPKRAPRPIAGTFLPVDPSGDGQFTIAAATEEKRRTLSVIVTNRGPTPERVVLGEICVG